MPKLARGKPAKELDPEELLKEVKYWRNVYSSLNSQAKRVIDMLGKQIRLTKRNYRHEMGLLVGIDFNLERFVIQTVTRDYDSAESKYFWRDKQKTIDSDIIHSFELIRKQVEEEEEHKIPEEISE